ncbi:lipopolysaccharide biosynthesis protein, partial [Micromonospora sp. NPDC003197]
EPLGEPDQGGLARRVRGESRERDMLGHVAGVIAAALLVFFGIVIVAAADLIADRLFKGDTTLVWVLVGALAALAVAHTTRGLLSGLQLFPWYGTQLGIDGALRIGLVAALGLAGVTSPFWYGMVLVFAPVVSVVCTLPPVLRAIGGGLPLPWAPLLRGLGLLTVSSLLAQVVVNIGVINVRLLEPDDEAIAGALLSALVLVRIPLFVFSSLQASLLPGLAASAATGDQSAFHSLLRRALMIVTALGAVGSFVATLLGPWLVRTLFAAPDVLTRVDFAWLSVGTLLYLWAMVLGQAILARDGHRAQALSWVVGTAALGVVTLIPMSVAQRVEIAYTVGSLLVVVSMALFLRRSAQTTHPSASLEPVTSSPATGDYR